MRPRRLRSADAETDSTVRVAAGRCQEGARCNCRGAEAQECSNRCSTSRQSTASVDHREQQLHRRPLGRRTSGRLAANSCTCGSDAGGSGRRDGDWWKSCHSTPTSPTRREAHAHVPQLPPSRCVHRCARHARTTCTRLRCGAGCFGGFCCTDRALHVGRAAACLAGPAAVCLPLHPPAACARARSIAASTRPLSAARRCRSGCECRRC